VAAIATASTVRLKDLRSRHRWLRETLNSVNAAIRLGVRRFFFPGTKGDLFAEQVNHKPNGPSDAAIHNIVPDRCLIYPQAALKVVGQQEDACGMAGRISREFGSRYGEKSMAESSRSDKNKACMIVRPNRGDLDAAFDCGPEEQGGQGGSG